MPPSLSGSRLLLGPALLLAVALIGCAFASPLDLLQDRLRTRIEAAHQGQPGALTVGTVPLQAREALVRYYQRADFAPGWVRADGPTARVDTLLAALHDAERDGLRPADYHVDLIDSLRTAAQGRSPDPDVLTALDLLCTDAFLLYAGHLLTGRVDPVAVTPTWTADQRRGDLVQSLTTALTDGTVRASLAALRPPYPEYQALVQALGRYREITAAGGWPSVPDGPTLKRGASSDRVTALRHRLHATGDLPADAPVDTTAFDDALHAAVVRFQERHGLAPDGAVGAGTRAALNVPAAERVRQLTINLERWRWLPEDLGSPHIRVNIAGFQLQVIEDGTEALRMRVVTGTPYRQTPVFSDRVSYLVFSPYWHVPHRLATQDKLPDFQRDPSLPSRLGFEAFHGWGSDAQPIAPSSIDWAALSPSNFPYRLRQKPGPANALGQVKFMFPNKHSVYLHDTPSRGLFARSERSFSSGCIRVEQPQELAAYLLRNNDGWTPDRIRTAMQQGTEQAVGLRETVPVHLLYWTAWMEGDTLHLRRDVYERDDAVAAALTAPLPPPQPLTAGATGA